MKSSLLLKFMASTLRRAHREGRSTNKMGISLNPALEERIAAKVRSGQYKSANDVVEKGLDLLEELDAVPPQMLPDGKEPVWEMAVRLGKQIPEEELLRIPPDFSRNLDHYLYGCPKEEE